MAYKECKESVVRSFKVAPISTTVLLVAVISSIAAALVVGGAIANYLQRLLGG